MTKGRRVILNSKSVRLKAHGWKITRDSLSDDDIEIQNIVKINTFPVFSRCFDGSNTFEKIFRNPFIMILVFGVPFAIGTIFLALNEHVFGCSKIEGIGYISNYSSELLNSVMTPRHLQLCVSNDVIGILGKIFVVPLVLYWSSNIYQDLDLIFIDLDRYSRFRRGGIGIKTDICEVFGNLGRRQPRIHLNALIVAITAQLFRISLIHSNKIPEYTDFNFNTFGSAGFQAVYSTGLYYMWAVMIVQFYHFAAAFSKALDSIPLETGDSELTIRFMNAKRFIANVRKIVVLSIGFAVVSVAFNYFRLDMLGINSDILSKLRELFMSYLLYFAILIYLILIIRKSNHLLRVHSLIEKSILASVIEVLLYIIFSILVIYFIYCLINGTLKTQYLFIVVPATLISAFGGLANVISRFK